MYAWQREMCLVSQFSNLYTVHVCFIHGLRAHTNKRKFMHTVHIIQELAGAVDFILAAMEANEGRVKQGCSLLLTMVSLPKEDPSYIAEERDLVLVQLEAQAERMVRVVEKYPEHESVRKDAVQVLRRMWAEDEGTARSKLLMLKQQIQSKPAARLLEDVFQVVKGSRKR